MQSLLPTHACTTSIFAAWMSCSSASGELAEGRQQSPAYGWQVACFGRSDNDVPEAPPLKCQRQLSGALDDVQCFVHAHLCDALQHTFLSEQHGASQTFCVALPSMLGLLWQETRKHSHISIGGELLMSKMHLGWPGWTR